MAKGNTRSGLDLGALQDTATNAARGLKAAATALKKAQANFDKAEAEHHVAQKSLSAGVDQLRAATKVLV